MPNALGKTKRIRQHTLKPIAGDRLKSVPESPFFFTKDPHGPPIQSPRLDSEEDIYHMALIMVCGIEVEDALIKSRAGSESGFMWSIGGHIYTMEGGLPLEGRGRKEYGRFLKKIHPTLYDHMDTVHRLSLTKLSPPSWHRLVEAGMEFRKASRMMQLIYPECDHVVWDNVIEKWTRKQIGTFDRLELGKDPPRTVERYRQLEKTARRMQKMVMPWATSLEADLLIRNGGMQ